MNNTKELVGKLFNKIRNPISEREKLLLILIMKITPNNIFIEGTEKSSQNNDDDFYQLISLIAELEFTPSNNSDLILELLCKISIVDFSIFRDIFVIYPEKLKDYETIIFSNDIKGNNQEKKIRMDMRQYIHQIGGYNNRFIFNTDSVKENKYDYSYSQCVYLDSNVVSYIKCIATKGINRYDTSSVYLKCFEMLEYINSIGIDISIYPYIIENINKSKIGSIEFNDFKETCIVCLLLIEYTVMDMVNYKSLLDSNSYKIIHCEKIFNGWCKLYCERNDYNIIQVQIVYALFLKAVIIHKSSKKNSKKKISELIEFINNELGIMMEFEFIILVGYLRNDNSLISFIKVLNNTYTNKLGQIKAMANDIYHLRKLEKTTNSPYNGNVEITLFSTFDKGLMDVFSFNPIKCICKCKSSEKQRVVYSKTVRDVLLDDVQINSIVSKADQRKQTYKIFEKNYDKLINTLETEYSKMISKSK